MSKRTVANKKIVLKDFSALTLEKRIELSAIGVYQIVFRGEADDTWKPKENSQVHRVWKMKKLEVRQQRAWKKFREDCQSMDGKSGGVTSGYGEFTDCGGEHEKVPTAFTNVYYDRVVDILQRYLGRREKALIYALIQDDLKSTDDFNLEFLGLLRSGYKNENDARTAGVVHVQNLLDRLADYYGF